MASVTRLVMSSIQPAEANCAVQMVSISMTSKPPPPVTAVVILFSKSLYCKMVWLTLIPVAAVKSATSGARLPVVSVHRKLTSPPAAAVVGGAVGARALVAGALVGAVVAGAAQAASTAPPAVRPAAFKKARRLIGIL